MAYQALHNRAFDLIVVDGQIEGIDSLELVESVDVIDPGVPVILMLRQEHRALWGDARALGANPILRPFKPLTFLRLVDTLLHQHLERYRYLSGVMTAALEELSRQPGIACPFLVDDSRQVLMSAGGCDDALLAQVSQLARGGLNPAPLPEHEPHPLLPPSPAEADHRLCVAPVVENLWLALLTPTSNDPYQLARWTHHLHFAVRQIQAALAENSALEEAALQPELPGSDSPLVIPLRLAEPLASGSAAPPPAGNDDDDAAVNWEIITRDSGLLDRLQAILAD
ncbi:MAG: hypothetical protein Kow0031_38710 [Anaerolineae bacterium]